MDKLEPYFSSTLLIWLLKIVIQLHIFTFKDAFLNIYGHTFAVECTTIFGELQEGEMLLQNIKDINDIS